MVSPPTPAPPRRFLRFSLRTFLAVSLALSLALGFFGRAWLKAYRDSQPPTLYELAQIAKRHGIPMPPKGAKLVLANTGERLGEQYRFSPAFLLQENSDGSVRILRGTSEETLTASDFLVFDGDPNVLLVREFSFEPVVDSHWEPRFNLHSAFVCACQLADRGDHDTAKRILEKIAGEKEWEDSVFEQSDTAPELIDLRLLTARCCYDGLESRICQEPAKWQEVRDSLDDLLTEFPKLGDERAAVLRDLTAALEAPAREAGSTEGLLVEWSREPGVYHGDGMFGPSYDQDANDSVDSTPQRIVLGGFDSLPGLIALRGDRRITAHYQSHIRWGPAPHVMRLGELADCYLWEITAYSGPDKDERDNWGDEGAWQRWWEAVRVEGELTFILRATFNWSVGQRITSVNEWPARIVARKHPWRLSEVCDQFCRDCESDTPPHELAAAVISTRLPLESRVALLTGLAEKLSIRQQPECLRALAALDKSYCVPVLLRILEKLPLERAEPNFDSYESGFADVVRDVNDLDSWRAYLGVTRRGHVDLRMQTICNLRYTRTPSSSQLAFLAAFIGDASERDSKFVERQPRLYSPKGCDEIAVRDIAALVTAEVLDMKVEPDSSWSPAQWFALREQVRERLKGEELPELE